MTFLKISAFTMIPFHPDGYYVDNEKSLISSW